MPMRIPANAIVLGRDEQQVPLLISPRDRFEHMHLVGTTGGGKSRLLELCGRQDIGFHHGVFFADPHGNHPGSLYRSLISYLATQRFAVPRTVHLIDPNLGTHITGFNPLELPTPEYEPPVVAEAMQEVLEKVWGGEDMNTKPTMQRVLAALLAALAELNLTVADARLLLDPDDAHGIRAWAIKNLMNEETRDELAWLHAMAHDDRGHHDFRQEITGPRNRLAKLTNNETIKLIVSHDASGIDFRAAIDEGHVILANLSPGPHAGDKATQLLGRLLTRAIFFHAVRRRESRPFFMYLDECQLYLSGDVSRLLAETRKYSVGVVASHQTLAQLRAVSDDMLDMVKSMTNIKVVMRIKDPAEAAELADMVVRHNVEMPVRSLIKPTLVGHRRTRMANASRSEQHAQTESIAETTGSSVTESWSETVGESVGVSASTTRTVSDSYGSSHSVSESDAASEARGHSTVVGLIPADAGHGAISGATLEGAAGTYADTSLGSPTRQLLGDARTARGAVSSVAVGQNRQRGHTRGTAVQKGSNSSHGHAVSSQHGTSHARSWSTTEGIAHTQSESTTVGDSYTHGHGISEGWSESLEPILEDRPTSVHSLETVRYMAGEVLRNFTAGRAAISFVNEKGLQTSVLHVARVRDCELTGEAFDRAREHLLAHSPSAVPIDQARELLRARQAALMRAAAALRDEPSTPTQYRSKKKRAERIEPSVEVHDQLSAPDRPAVKGPDRRRRRPKAALD